MSHHKYSKYSVYIGVLLALVFTVTCRLQPFSSVRIKASPKVYLPLGSKNITEDEVCKRFEETVQKNTVGATDKNIRLYRYHPSGNANDTPIRYLVHYPLETFDFNINSYFNGDPLGNSGAESGDTNLLSRKFDTEISIPKINESKNITINAADINQKLLDKFNTDAPVSVSVPAIPGEHTLPPVNIDFQGFETITFSDGSYLKISARPDSPSVSYEIAKAKMESNGQTILGDITGYDAYFPLDNKTINKSIILTLTVKDVAGGPGTATISRMLNGTIIRATGVNAEPEITLAQGSVDMPLPEDFHSATIGVGELKLSMVQPAGWTGITIEKQTTITQAGGLTINPSGFQPLNTPVSLIGQTLNNQRSLTYEPKLKVKLANATYTYQENLSVNFNFSIDIFSSITMKNNADFKKQQSEPVPDGIKNWVKTIHFKTTSVKINLKNGLPAGNDIKIKLSSTCFKITPPPAQPQEETFSPGETEKEYKCNDGNAFDLDIEHLDNFDLTTQVLLPGYNEHDNTFTLNNIHTDSKIEFSGAVQFNLNWETITLKAKNNQTVSFPQTGSMDLSALTSKLKDSDIKLEEIPLYFYAGSDSGLLGNTKMNVKLTTQYVKTGTTEIISTDLVDKSDIPLKGLPVDTFSSDIKPFTGTIPPAMLSIKQEEPDIKATFASILNEYPKDLQFTCTLNMNEITIKREDYDKPENKNTKVSIDLLLDLPVGFKVESNHELSLTDMFGLNISGTDLFGRSSRSDNSVFNNAQVSDALRSIKVRINFKNGLKVAPGFVLRFKDGSGAPVKDDSGSTIEKIVTTEGEQTIILTSKEWKNLLDTYPVSPEFLLKLPSGSYSLKNNFELGASLAVLAETDINYTIKVN